MLVGKEQLGERLLCREQEAELSPTRVGKALTLRGYADNSLGKGSALCSMSGGLCRHSRGVNASQIALTVPQPRHRDHLLTGAQAREMAQSPAPAGVLSIPLDQPHGA